MDPITSVSHNGDTTLAVLWAHALARGVVIYTLIWRPYIMHVVGTFNPILDSVTRILLQNAGAKI